MIPKIIHYCWFGRNPLPLLALECIASWKKYLPDYEIWQWSEEPLHENDNENENLAAQSLQHINIRPDKIMPFDVNIIPYTAEAYKQKKYAFVSDYARFWIIYKYGGIYFDTDVEVIKSFEDIVSEGSFMGFEINPKEQGKMNNLVNPGLGIGMEPNMTIIKNLLDYYNCLHFESIGNDIKTIVGHTTDILVEHGLQNIDGIQKICGISIYPSEYFCPINIITKRLHVTKNTHSIHRYMDSWNDKKSLCWKDKVRKYIPEWVLLLNNKLKK